MTDPSGLDEVLYVSHNGQYMFPTLCRHILSRHFFHSGIRSLQLEIQNRPSSTASALSPRLAENKGSSKPPNEEVGLVVGRVELEWV